MAEGRSPSTNLRKWFGHDPPIGSSFRSATGKNWARRRPRSVEQKAKAHPHLVYGAGNEEHNEAVVLKRILEGYRMEDEL